MSIAATLNTLISDKIGKTGMRVTPNQVARATGVPQATLSRILNGRVTDVRGKSLEKLADYFGVTTAYLRGESGALRAVPAAAPVAPADDQAKHLIYATLEEINCLSAYRAANKVGRMAILAAVNALSQQQLDTAIPGNVTRLRP